MALENFRDEILDIIDNMCIELKTSESKLELEKIKTKLLDYHPTIMVYGVFNSGKSTLINALLRSDKAKIADIPTTDSIDKFEWNSYVLYDTPGINAPMEHEKITTEHLIKTDVIFFVLSTSSEHAESYIYDRLFEIISHNKPVIVLINDKDELIETDDMADIINVISAQLTNRLKDPRLLPGIIAVNANDALEGYLNDENSLIEGSQIETVERELKDLIVNKGANGIISSTVNILLNVVSDEINSCTNEITNKDVKEYQYMINFIESRINHIVKKSKSHIQNIGESLLDQIILDDSLNPNDVMVSFESDLLALYRQLFDNIIIELKNRYSGLDEYIRSFDFSFPNVSSLLIDTFSSKLAEKIPEEIDLSKLNISAAGNDKEENILEVVKELYNTTAPAGILIEEMNNKKKDELIRNELIEKTEELNRLNKKELEYKKSVIQEKILYVNSQRNKLHDKSLSIINEISETVLIPIINHSKDCINKMLLEKDKNILKLERMELESERLKRISAFMTDLAT